MTRKRSAYRPRGINPTAHLMAMRGASLLSLDDRTVWALELHGAVGAVARAQADRRHWAAIFDAVNLVEELVSMRCARDEHGLVQAAQSACLAILDRQRSTGTKAARAAELAALRDLAGAWVEIMDGITHSERFAAGEGVARRTQRALRAPQAGVTVVDAVEMAP